MTAVRIIDEDGATVVETDFRMRPAQLVGVAVEGGETTLLVRLSGAPLSATMADATTTTPGTPVLDHLRS